MSRKENRASAKRSVAVDSNTGIISTGDHASITLKQKTQKARRPKHVIYGDIPRRPPAFQVRDHLRDQLVNAGQCTIISTLTGARGIGKSQLAAAYARECIDNEWSLVAWIGAGHSEQILSGLDHLSRLMGISEATNDPITAATKLRRWLEGSRDEQCLIVFDNATDPDSLAKWLPSVGKARIVITSNRRSFADFGTLIDVEAFTAGEARTYLFERTGLHDEVGADALSAEVGGLPLALAQASAVIRAQRLSYAEFLNRLQKVPLDKYLKRQIGDAYPRGAAETVILSVEQAGRGSKLNRALLLLLSILSPDGVSRELLYSVPVGGRVIQWPWGAGRKVSPVCIDEAIQQLTEMSLITASVNGQTIIMHRFTQRVVRERAEHDGSYPLLILQVARFFAAHHDHNKLPEELPTPAKDLVQQISSLWNVIGVESRTDFDHIMRKAGYFGKRTGRKYMPVLQHLRVWSVSELSRRGHAAYAVELGTSVLNYCQAALGPDHSETLAVSDFLVDAYRGAGQFNEAIDLGLRNLADCERILGADNPMTLTSRSKLAMAYHSAKKMDEAIALSTQTLDDRERILGPDHTDTLTSRSNLAIAYRDAGRLKEAIELSTRALADRERASGPDHPATITSRNNLARAYHDAGRLNEAIELDIRTLADNERISGANHPNTLNSRSCLAADYHAVGRVDEAIDLCEQTLADRERTLGFDHPDTLISRANLGIYYRATNRFDEAINLHEGVLADRERILGKDDPQTLTTREFVAFDYYGAGRINEAINLHQRILADRERILGPDDPSTISSRRHLSNLYKLRAARQGRGPARGPRRKRN